MTALDMAMGVLARGVSARGVSIDFTKEYSPMSAGTLCVLRGLIFFGMLNYTSSQRLSTRMNYDPTILLPVEYPCIDGPFKTT